VRLKDQLLDSRDRPSPPFFIVEDDNFVLPGLEPLGGKKQALLRANAPVASKIMSIHPDDAFAPAAHIEICIADLARGKASAMKSRPRVPSSGEPQVRKVIERK